MKRVSFALEFDEYFSSQTDFPMPYKPLMGDVKNALVEFKEQEAGWRRVFINIVLTALVMVNSE